MPILPETSAPRKDTELRGGLNAMRRAAPAVTDKKDAEVVLDHLQEVLGDGVPWLGPTVPPWARTIDDPQAIKVRRLFEEEFNSWDFDLSSLDKLTNGNPLTFVGWEALLRCSFFCEF